MTRKRPYLDAKLSAETRARDLLGRMTLEEKIWQMGMVHTAEFLRDGGLTRRAMHKLFEGMSIGCVFDQRSDMKTAIKAGNALQKYFVERTRLGIPAFFGAECLHGHNAPGATVFPACIAVASTWETKFARRMGRAAAREARSVGKTVAYAPNLDLAREPRWGRVEETYGEDPHLVSRMGVAYVKGMQGEGEAIGRDGVVATVKHYAAHGSPESGINLAPVAGGERELRTVYLPSFRAAIKEGGALAVMSAYSEYDGVPATASRLLLTRILREEWGFKGFVSTDCMAMEMLHNFHRTARTPEEAGMQALEAGVDMEEPVGYCWGRKLVDLVRKGEVSVDLVNRAVMRILRVKFLAGIFEYPYADAANAARVVNCAAHRRLSREIAQEAIILLKNENSLLPLDPGLGRIAVIGPNADAARIGGYCKAKQDDVTPLEGIRKAVSRRTKIVFARGCGIWGGSRDGFGEAVAVAKESDAAILVIGGVSNVDAGLGWGGDARPMTCGEGRDRSDLDPPGVQGELVQAVHETGTPTIVVLVHGRPYTVEWMAEHVPALVEAWYPGDQGGHALADVLFGKVNPSGRLPVSIPRRTGHVPVFYNHKPSARGFYHTPGTPERPGRDYVFSSPEPLFPFGHGLSYTTFRYANLRVSPRKIRPAGRVKVSVDVRNAGKIVGKEVVQLYLNDVASTVTTPVKALRRFEKIALQPGERRTVNFVLAPEDMEILDVNMKRVVEAGVFEVTAGPLTTKFEVIEPSRGGT